MDIETFRNYCLGRFAATEDMPFDNETLVFRIGQKMFALVNVERFDSVNLKCDPERALELRERYAGIQPGWHMNKKHWNTVQLFSDVPDSLLLELVDHSYALVRASLPKALRQELDALEQEEGR